MTWWRCCPECGKMFPWDCRCPKCGHVFGEREPFASDHTEPLDKPLAAGGAWTGTEWNRYKLLHPAKERGGKADDMWKE